MSHLIVYIVSSMIFFCFFYNLLIDILFRSGWAAPLAICFILFVLLLIAGTIVLALIPLYLSPKDIQGVSNQSISSIIIF
jgi:hypothetical protein